MRTAHIAIRSSDKSMAQLRSGFVKAWKSAKYQASDRKICWPLNAAILESRKKDEALFESLAAINERFAKLQDTLGAAMRLAGRSVRTPTGI